ncbi:MAG TPA: NHLP leader peptide family RiPP precursor [Gemmatimonadaceae bacterium]|nr:NHLP leader peptide family RiPP precursor [Gemmatimonadaceae bacterium]
MTSTTNAQMHHAETAYAKLLERSAVDRDFRRQLLTNPRAALAAITGREVAESVTIKFVENTADATIVLPNFVGDAELSEADLSAVAGGTNVLTLPLAAILIGQVLPETLRGGDPAP